jgi:glycosyltransferase involved in cell wall biosynthesis
MNCFNGEAFLRQAIESVLAQSFTNWEIVFWDNQSTDGSADIVKSYDDPRIHYYYAPTHTLLYEARNYAIEKSAGEYLAFLDVDDWWLADKLEQQVPLFVDPTVAVVYGNYLVVNETKEKRWVAYTDQLPQGNILDRLLEDYRVGLLTLMIRRAALPFGSTPFNPDFHMIGDLDLVIRLAAKHRVACVQRTVAIYRIHGGNETAKRRNQNIAELNIWRERMANDPVIGLSKSFYHVRTQVEYSRGMCALLEGNRKQAIEPFRRMHWGRHKFRLLIAFFLTVSRLNKVKN